jgi:hypothetical protein
MSSELLRGLLFSFSPDLAPLEEFVCVRARDNLIFVDGYYFPSQISNTLNFFACCVSPFGWIYFSMAFQRGLAQPFLWMAWIRVMQLYWPPILWN